MKVFLFPLVNVTLFPKTTKPLNVFESRYLEMVRDAVATDTPVAIGFIEDPSLIGSVNPGEEVSFVRGVAGYGQVQIVEERANGTVLVFVQGKGKVRLGKVQASPKPYLICEAEVLFENQLVLSSSSAKVQTLNKLLAHWIRTHIPDQAQRQIFMSQLLGPEEIIGAFAAYLVKDYDLQQLILEMDDINEKIEFLYRLAESSEMTT